ncbi:Ig-like domain repeat protein [Methanobrevibacter sp.]
MKLKHMILVSLILAILTIGAVSASDDLMSDDDLAVSDEGVDEISLDDDSEDTLSEPTQEDFDVEYKQEVNLDDVESEIYDDTVIKVESNKEEMEYDGNLTVDVGQEGYVNVYNEEFDRNAYFDLNDLEITSAGEYKVLVNFVPTSGSAITLLDTTINVVKKELTSYIELSFPDELTATEDVEVRVDFAEDVDGNIILFIDNNEVYESAVYDLRYDDLNEELCNYGIIWIDDAYLFELPLGKHNYTLMYYGGKYDDKNFTGEFNLSYSFRVYSEELEDAESNEVIYGDEVTFTISIPEDGTGDVILIANNKTYTIKMTDSEIEYSFSDLKMGENNLTFTYEDKKYSKKSVNFILEVTSEIDIPKSFSYNGDEAITLILPGDAKGNLTVYYAVEDSEGYVLGDIIKTTPLKDGKASISLSDLPFGYYNILARYSGDDYEIEDAIGSISVLPKVIYDEYVWIEENHTVTIVMPEDIKGNLTVTLIQDPDSGEDAISAVLYDGIAKTMTLTLPKLNATEYYINLAYVLNETGVFSESYLMVARNTNPVWEMGLDFPTVATKSDDEKSFYIYNVPDDLEYGYVTVYIGGNLFKTCYYNAEGGLDGETDLDFAKLNYGTYAWKVVFTDDYGYYKNATKEGTLEVTWINIPEEVTVDEDEIFFSTDENATGYFSVLIDGKDYAMEFVEGGRVEIPLTGLTVGTHTYEVTYSGDKTHEKLTKSGSFKVVMSFKLYGIYDNETYCVSESYEISTDLPNAATGTVTITVGGKTYTETVVKGSAYFTIKDLKEGNYTIVAKYSGDNKYSSQEIIRNFTIEGYSIQPIYESDYDDEYIVGYSLTLPNNATGNLTVYSAVYDDVDEEYVPDEFIKSIPLKDGKASFYIDDLGLPYGAYEIIMVYESDDDNYTVEKHYHEGDIYPKVNVTYEVYMGEDAKISIDFGNATGNITIYLNGNNLTTEQLKDGKLNVIIPGAKLVLGENIVTLEYIGEDLSEDLFYNVGEDGPEPVTYEIDVKIKGFELPEEFPSTGKGNMTIELPEGASGNITVKVDGKNISTIPVKAGNNTIPITNLTQGYNYVTIEYVDDNGQKYSDDFYVNVPKPDATVDIATPTDSETPQFTVNLPSDATGSLIVNVGGKNYAADLVNGSATIVPDLADGTYEATIKYTGDGNYSKFTKKVNVTIKTTKKVDPKITAKDLKVIYSAGSKYTVTVYGADGKVAAGVKVTFLINGKTFKTVTTNAKGIATVKITQKPGTYKITTKALGKEVTKKLTVKHVLKLKKVKVKRSAKKLVLKATLSKVNGKYLKGKKITFKFKGKKYTAKTNKKGVAKVTIKKKVLKKLKKGKKVTYQATYLKDTVKYSVKVKK